MKKETVLRNNSERLNKLVALEKALNDLSHKALENITKVDNNDLSASVHNLTMAYVDIRYAIDTLLDCDKKAVLLSDTHELLKHYNNAKNTYIVTHGLERDCITSLTIEYYRGELLLADSALYYITLHYEEEIQRLQTLIGNADVMEAC